MFSRERLNKVFIDKPINIKIKLVFKLGKALLMYFIPIIIALIIAAVVSHGKNYSIQGQNYLNNGKYDKAIECFNKRLKDYPKDNEALMGKAKALYGLEKYEDAISIYKILVEIGSKDKEVYFGIGCSYYNLNKFNQVAKTIT